MKPEILGSDEVLQALLDGYEVLYIKTNETHKFGVSCRQLTKEIYNTIDSIVRNATDNDVFIKIEKEDNKDEQTVANES